MEHERVPSLLGRLFGVGKGRRGSLRRLLLVAFLALTFIPAIILGPILRQQVAAQTTELIVGQLSLVSTLKEQQIQDFLEERTQDLGQVIRTVEARENVLFLLQNSPDADGYRFTQGLTYDLFLSVQRETDDFAELFLVDRDGIVILSTDADHRGADESTQAFLSEGLQDNYISPLLSDPESGETFVYLAEPVRDFSTGGIPRGILVARLDPSALAGLMLEDTGLGETGETYLVSAEGQLLTPVREQSDTSLDLNTYGIQESLAGRQGSDQYPNYAGTEVIGFYRWLPEVGAGLLAEQASSEAFAVLDQLTRFALIAGAIGAIVVTTAIWAITGQISRPIVQLTESATKVASGEFGHTVPVTRSDEVGILAESFNQMSVALQDIYDNLEQKVAERTEQLAAANAYLTALHETTLGLISRLDLTDLLQNLITRAGELLDAPYGYIYLVEAETDALELKVAVGISGQQVGERVGLGEGLSGKVWESGQPLVVDDYDSWEGRSPNIVRNVLHAMASVPLTQSGSNSHSDPQVVGVIGLGYGDESDQTFGDEEVELLTRFAELASIALDNARLYTEAQEARERLKSENLRMSAELDVTRKLQHMLLPTPDELRHIEGLDIAGYMEPADEVGGDYYDVLQHDGRVKIGIGDVTGHGLESGVLMLMTQMAVRTLLISNETDPVRFLTTLNQAIYDNVQRMQADKNLTLALLDYKAGQLKLSGQHEEMIVVRRGGQVELVDTLDLGFPIGLDENIAEFVAETSVRLQPGDGVILYTDGITEAENSAGELYGLERLCTVVGHHWDETAEVIKQAVVDDVLKHIGTQKIYDDLTLLVLKQQ